MVVTTYLPTTWAADEDAAPLAPLVAPLFVAAPFAAPPLVLTYLVPPPLVATLLAFVLIGKIPTPTSLGAFLLVRSMCIGAFFLRGSYHKYSSPFLTT